MMIKIDDIFMLNECCEEKPYLYICNAMDKINYVFRLQIIIKCTREVCKRKVLVEKKDGDNILIEIKNAFKEWNDSFVYCKNHFEMMKNSKNIRLVGDGTGDHFDFYCNTCLNFVKFSAKTTEILPKEKVK